MTNRRAFILGAAAVLAAPAIVKAESLMKAAVLRRRAVVSGSLIDTNRLTFDDYEEGKWTETLMVSNGFMREYRAVSGHYVKRGPVVFVHGEIDLREDATIVVAKHRFVLPSIYV